MSDTIKKYKQYIYKNGEYRQVSGGGGSGGSEPSGGGAGDGDILIKSMKFVYDVPVDYSEIFSEFFLRDKDDYEEIIINKAKHIFVEFTSSLIDSNFEAEINNGKAIIRLDYPVRHKGCFRDNGAGERGFAHNINYAYAGDVGEIIENAHKELFEDTFIYLSASDIKTDVYGRKYIQKRVSFFDLCQKMIFNFLYNHNGETLEPVNFSTGEEASISSSFDFIVGGHFYSKRSGLKTHLPYINSVCNVSSFSRRHLDIIDYGDDVLPGIPDSLNKDYFACAPIKISNINNFSSEGITTHFSLYVRNKKMCSTSFTTLNNWSNKNVLVCNIGETYCKPRNPKRDTETLFITKPRFAVLKDNWSSLAYNVDMWKVRYPQTTQQLWFDLIAFYDAEDFQFATVKSGIKKPLGK